MELDQEQEETMQCQCVLRCQPSVLDVTAYSGEEFDWGDLENVQRTDDTDVDSDCGSFKLSADGSAATTKQTKVSTKHQLPNSLDH